MKEHLERLTQSWSPGRATSGASMDSTEHDHADALSPAARYFADQADPAPAPPPDAGGCDRETCPECMDRARREQWIRARDEENAARHAAAKPPAPEATGEMSEEDVIDVVSSLPGDAAVRQRLLAHDAALRASREAERQRADRAEALVEATRADDRTGLALHLLRVFRERDEAREQRDRLLGQLPVGMKHCVIVFRRCPVGHGWLTATNWADFPCPTCTLAAANARADRAEQSVGALMVGHLHDDALLAAQQLMDTERATRLKAESERDAWRTALRSRFTDCPDDPEMAGTVLGTYVRTTDGANAALRERLAAAEAEVKRLKDEAKAPRWLCEGCGWIGTSIQGGGHFRAPDDHCGPCVPLDEGARRLAERLPLAEREREELRAAWIAEDYEIRQVLGKALGYPPPPDAQPGDGVVTGPHTGTTLADEAASRLAAAEADVASIKHWHERELRGIRTDLTTDQLRLVLGKVIKDCHDALHTVREEAAALRARAQRLEEEGDAMASGNLGLADMRARWAAVKADAPAKEGKS